MLSLTQSEKYALLHIVCRRFNTSNCLFVSSIEARPGIDFWNLNCRVLLRWELSALANAMGQQLSSCDCVIAVGGLRTCWSASVHVTKSWLLAGLVLACAVPLSAQEKWSVDDAVRIALATHPLLAGRTAHIAALQSVTTQAGLRPNPRFVVQSENWKFAGAAPFNIRSSTDQFAYITQVIETAQKRQRRVELSQENTQLAGLDRELLQQQIAARVKYAYWAAVGAERIRQLWVEHEDNFRQTISYHEARVR